MQRAHVWLEAKQPSDLKAGAQNVSASGLWFMLFFCSQTEPANPCLLVFFFPPFHISPAIPNHVTTGSANRERGTQVCNNHGYLSFFLLLKVSSQLNVHYQKKGPTFFPPTSPQLPDNIQKKRTNQNIIKLHILYQIQ